MAMGIEDAEVAIAVAFLVMLFFVCLTMRLFVCWLRTYFVVEVTYLFDLKVPDAKNTTLANIAVGRE